MLALVKQAPKLLESFHVILFLEQFEGFILE
jgi:hypothetical protein